MDLYDFDDLLVLLAYRSRQQPQHVRTGQSKLLDSAHPERVHYVLRMQLGTFYALRDWLLANAELKGDDIIRNQRIRGYGRQISVEEKLGIFIYIVSRGASNRDTAERFSRGIKAISQ
ncbi:hypothetical protein V1517DRAFT_334175 [Lipomyces orientalis]|uniref:Uncharacterized protein n=1 Tax=Lipomyces orientalis TaxID=1233043 RepID=A0ACC3TDT2_9ASCO